MNILVPRAYDLLVSGWIVGPGNSRYRMSRISRHPEAHAQCNKFLVRILRKRTGNFKNKRVIKAWSEHREELRRTRMAFEKAMQKSFKILQLPENIELKKEQESALRAVVLQKKDCLCVLPTGFGKSLIFQLIPFVCDQLDGTTDSCVLVVSPLNAIISDQIEKLTSRGIDIVVFKQGNEDFIPSVKDTVKFIYGHAEVFVESAALKKILRDKCFQRRVKAVCIDEAHFIVEW